MIMSDALCGSSISYSPLSFITSRTLTTAPPFRTSPEEMAAVCGMSTRMGGLQADGREGGRGVCVVAYSVAPTAPAAYHSALYRTSKLVYFEFRIVDILYPSCGLCTHPKDTSKQELPSPISIDHRGGLPLRRSRKRTLTTGKAPPPSLSPLLF